MRMMIADDAVVVAFLLFGDSSSANETKAKNEKIVGEMWVTRI
jgi:hypothetical protein